MLTLPQSIFDQIIAHARESSPHETCGLLAGKDNLINKIFELENKELESPKTRYALDPVQQFAVLKKIHTSDKQLLGIYHSHPASPAYPSATDVKLAFYPEAAYFICSLATVKPVLKAFRIENEKITEIKFRISR